MTVGTKNKKSVYALIVLGVIAAYTFYTNVLAGPDAPASSHRAATGQAGTISSAAQGVAGPNIPPPPKRAATKISRGEEFHPALHPKNEKERPDPHTIDPTLKLDLLAKVQAVELAGGARNLFQFGPPPPDPNALKAKDEPKIQVAAFVGPRLPPPPAPPPPKVEPPPPPITLKFYGYSTTIENGKKTVYLLDGDEIYLAREGDTVKRRYKVVRINPTSVLIEDLDAKRQQSVPLVEEEKSE